MALKKPSDLFNKKETSRVFNSPEVSSAVTETYDRFRDNFDNINILSEKVEKLSQQLSEKLNKSDLETAMLSQLMVLDENFKSLQNQVKGLNKEDLREFRTTVSNLTEIVGNLIEKELPKYRKQVTKNELNFGEKFDIFKDIVEENIFDIREEVDAKVSGIAEVIDNNLQYFNDQLQETSNEVKRTTNTYNNLSKIVESRVSKENEKLEEYSQVIKSLYESFVELEKSLQEETSTYLQVIEDKFEYISLDVKNRIDNINEEVGNISNKVYSEISTIKADVVINEQHFKNVDKYIQEHHQGLAELKEEVFGEIEKLPVGNIQENLERLEKKIDYIKETYSKIEPEIIVKEVIKEGLLNEPPETKNSDPITPTNQNFVTLDQLQQHYRLFINRIQQQLSTLGGGGETRFRYLDDVVGIATNSSAYDGKFLQWNSTTNTAEFVTVTGVGTTGGGGGGSQGIQGTEGTQGVQGTEGIQGTQGTEGPQGTTGQGTQGIQGTEGTQGTIGVQGTTGQGTQGIQGIQGTTGVQGATGVQGTTGQGTQGTQGIQGTTGVQGTTGTQGVQGVQGIDGSLILNTNNNFSGIATFSGNLFSTSVLQIQQVEETYTTYSTTINSGATISLDCSNGNTFYVTSTVNGNWTANLTNLALSANCLTNVTLMITQGATAYIPNALQIGGVSQTINWQGGSIPSGNNSKKDAIAFTIFNSGAGYNIFGQLVTFG